MFSPPISLHSTLTLQRQGRMLASSITCKQALLSVSGQYGIHPLHRQCNPQDPDGRPAGKCLSGEIEREPASADTAQSAAPPTEEAGQPGTSGISMLWLEGKSIVDLYTPKGKACEAPPCQSRPVQYAACNTCFHRHTGNTDFAIGSEDTRAAVF